MNPQETLIRTFYDAFARGDAEAMAACYHPNVFFTDPVFPSLHGPEAGDMWRMLLARAQDLRVTLEEVSANESGGHARWTARYTFARTGRPVVNNVEALFAFRDGLIVRHYDRFPFWGWSRQALGPVGRFLGWAQPFKWKVRKDAAVALENFRHRR